MNTNIYQSEVAQLKSFNNLFIEMSAKSCNQHCKHCYIDFPRYKKVEDFIDLDTIKEALNDTKQFPINCIYLTGAEPMTHPNFNTILRLCLQRTNVCICTNGSFINEKKARFLKKVEDETKNEIIFKISIDYFEEDKNDEIRYRGAFRQAVFAIKYLTKYAFEPIVCVTNYWNESEQNLFDGFKKVFQDCDFDFDKSHLQINPYFDKNKPQTENFKRCAKQLDCEYGRMLTVSGIYTCPFLSDDYRGRCGSSFKDFANKVTLETNCCSTCLNAQKGIFSIDFSKFS